MRPGLRCLLRRRVQAQLVVIDLPAQFAGEKGGGGRGEGEKREGRRGVWGGGEEEKEGGEGGERGGGGGGGGAGLEGRMRGMRSTQRGARGCCARAPSGQAAALPSTAINSRRPMLTGMVPLSARGLPRERNIPRRERAVFTFGRTGMPVVRRNRNDSSGSLTSD